MNQTITRCLSAVAILALTMWTAQINGQSQEQLDRFNEERIAYFTEQLELTKAEAEAFWPLYNDFQNRKMKIHEDERNTFRYSHENAENLSEQEIKENLDKIQLLKSDGYKLEQEYYGEKFLEALPPKKVLKLYKVEWDFRHYLIRKLRGEGKVGPGQRGKGRSGGGPGMLPPPDH